MQVEYKHYVYTVTFIVNTTENFISHLHCNQRSSGAYHSTRATNRVNFSNVIILINSWCITILLRKATIWHENNFIIRSVNFFSFSFLFLFTLPQSKIYTPRDLQTKCRWSDACRGSNSLWTSTLDRYTKGGPPWMCGPHNVRASAEDNTGHNTDKGHTPNPRT